MGWNRAQCGPVAQSPRVINIGFSRSISIETQPERPTSDLGTVLLREALGATGMIDGIWCAGCGGQKIEALLDKTSDIDPTTG
jgi:hypothetical protein